MAGKLYHRIGTVYPRYYSVGATDNDGYQSISRDYSTCQIIISLTSINFDYTKMKADGSDIVFYQKIDGAWELVPFYQWSWNWGGTSTFILKLTNVKHDEPCYIAVQYGKDYDVTGRPTLRTEDIEEVVEMWDDFDTFDANKWDEVPAYSISDSKITLLRDRTDNPRTPRFYTKQRFNNHEYDFLLKAKFTQTNVAGHYEGAQWVAGHDTPYGLYWGVNPERTSGYPKGYLFGDPTYIQFDTRYHGCYWYAFSPASYNCLPVKSSYIGAGMIDITPNYHLGEWKIYGIHEASNIHGHRMAFSNHDANLGAVGGLGCPTNMVQPSTNSAFGFFGSSESACEADWAMVVTSQYFWDVLSWTPELEPHLVIVNPLLQEYSLIPLVRVEAHEFLGNDNILLDTTINTDDHELCINWLDRVMTPDGIYDAHWEYKMTEPDDFLARGKFEVLAEATDKWGMIVDELKDVNIINAIAEYEWNTLTRDFETLSGVITFSLRNLTEERVNIRNFLNKINQNNNLVPLNISDSDCLFRDNYLLGIKTTPIAEEQYTVSFQFEQEEIYDRLNDKLIEVDSRVVLYNLNGTPWDISSFVRTYSIDRKSSLGASEVSVELYLVPELSPFYSGEPYGFYGNKLEIYQNTKMADGTIQEDRKWTGYVSEIGCTKVAIHITAHDKMKRFSNKTSKDYYFSPTKTYVTEYLETFDGTKFRSKYKGWCQYPIPQIFVGDTALQQGEYTIDYYRGEVYIFRNTLLSGNVRVSEFLANDVSDRKTFHVTGYNIDYSVSPQVDHTWREKVDFACVGGIGKDEVWIDKFETLELDEFYVDYNTNSVILYNPLPVDTATVDNHSIKITTRDTQRVQAKFYYQTAGTNEVEDIIQQLATEVGFTASELEDTVTGERVSKGAGNVLYTEKNHIKAITSATINGIDVAGVFNIDYKQGKLTAIKDINLIETPLDPMVSLLHVEVSSGKTPILDTVDFYYADASIKITLDASEAIAWNYDRHYFRKYCPPYTKMGLYVKVNKACSFWVNVYDSNNTGFVTDAFTVSAENAGKWIKYDLSAMPSLTRDHINRLELRSQDNDVTFNIDYFHLQEDVIELSYTYYTLQNTDITVNEVWYLTEEVEDFNGILEDLMKTIDPSYLVYVDKDGKLRGEFKRITSYVMEGQLIKHWFVDKTAYAGYFYLPDMYLKMIKTADTSISDEEVFTAVQVLGKLSDKNNSALFALATDVCTWASGTAYSKYNRDILGQYARYVPPDVPLVYIRRLQAQAPTDYKGTCVVDADVWSGVNWYLMQENNSDMSHTMNTPMIEIQLPEEILFDEIAVCVGSYNNKVIREELYVEVQDSDGNKWFPSGDFPNKQNGNTSTWLKFKNEFNKNKKIKTVRVFCAEPWRWIESDKTKTTGGKK